MSGKTKSLTILIILCQMCFASFTKTANAQAIDFEPKRDGFSFENYEKTTKFDLMKEDLMMMFGADKVCAGNNATIKNCVLTETAKEWMKNELKEMQFGHCHGMAVASLRMWHKLPFKGKSLLTDWMESAKSVYDLKLNGNITNYISYFHALQLLDEVRNRRIYLKDKNIVEILADSFNNKGELYTLSYDYLIPGEESAKHAVTPIGIAKENESEFKVFVYDNNYPGEKPYLLINTKTGSWKYPYANERNRRTKKEGDPSQIWIVPMSARELKTYTCPFKNGGNPQVKRSNGGRDNGRINFSLGGEGRVLITDPNGSQIGYDANKKKQINEVSGAEVYYRESAADNLILSPEYFLPFVPEAAKPYQVLLSGNGLEKKSSTNFSITAPGFVVGFEEISLDTDEQLKISIAPDGHSLRFTASADGETPTLYITTENGNDQPSYGFKISGVAIGADKSLTLSYDFENGKVYFKDDNGREDAYDIEFKRTTADEGEIEFSGSTANLKGIDNFEVDLNDWEGETEPCVKKDGNGNGFEDDACQNEDQEDEDENL